MNPFPPFEQLAFLLGAELSNITLQPYSVDFRFVDGTLLVVEHGVEYVDENRRVHNHDPQQGLGPDPVAFHALIQRRVAEIHVEPFRLTLVFDGGQRLTILSKPGPYESGHIRRGGSGTDLLVF